MARPKKLVPLKPGDGYLKKSQVNIEAVNYRPCAILSEVKRPGSCAYVEGTTIGNAVAMRADSPTVPARKILSSTRRRPQDSDARH